MTLEDEIKEKYYCALASERNGEGGMVKISWQQLGDWLEILRVGVSREPVATRSLEDYQNGWKEGYAKGYGAGFDHASELKAHPT